VCFAPCVTALCLLDAHINIQQLRVKHAYSYHVTALCLHQHSAVAGGVAYFCHVTALCLLDAHINITLACHCLCSLCLSLLHGKAFVTSGTLLHVAVVRQA